MMIKTMINKKEAMAFLYPTKTKIILGIIITLIFPVSFYISTEYCNFSFGRTVDDMCIQPIYNLVGLDLLYLMIFMSPILLPTKTLSLYLFGEQTWIALPIFILIHIFLSYLLSSYLVIAKANKFYLTKKWNINKIFVLFLCGIVGLIFLMYFGFLVGIFGYLLVDLYLTNIDKAKK